MHYMKFLVGGAFAVLAVLTACEEEQPQVEPEKPTLYVVSEFDGEFSAEGNTTTLNVTSNADWSAFSSVTWVTLNPANGSKDGKVTLTVAPNTSSEARQGKLVFYAGQDRNGDRVIDTGDADAYNPVAKFVMTVKQR